MLLSYLKYLFCLSAITYVEVEAKYLDLHNVGQDYYNHEITDGNKVDVKMYYECLCPGCGEMLTYDVNDTYAEMGSYIDLKLYPYGNAHRKEKNGTVKIICQHGPEECHGNKLHACAIDILNSVPRSLYYITCMMMAHWGGYGSTDIDATKCGQLMNIDSKPIIECANGEKGETLLEYYGKETDKTHHIYTPWVLINGKLFDLETETKSFKQKVCEALANPPPECGHQ